MVRLAVGLSLPVGLAEALVHDPQFRRTAWTSFSGARRLLCHIALRLYGGRYGCPRERVALLLTGAPWDNGHGERVPHWRVVCGAFCLGSRT